MQHNFEVLVHFLLRVIERVEKLLKDPESVVLTQFDRLLSGSRTNIFTFSRSHVIRNRLLLRAFFGHVSGSHVYMKSLHYTRLFVGRPNEFEDDM